MNTFHLYCLPWGCTILVFPLIYYQAHFLLIPEEQGSASEMQEAVNTSQAWIYLSRGEPKDTPDPPCLYPGILCSLQCGMQGQHLRACLHVSANVCAMQQRSHKERRTGEMETLPFSSLALKATKSACHTRPCRKSSMLSEGRHGVQSQQVGRQKSKYKRNDLKRHGGFS